MKTLLCSELQISDLGDTTIIIIANVGIPHPMILVKVQVTLSTALVPTCFPVERYDVLVNPLVLLTYLNFERPSKGGAIIVPADGWSLD